MRIRFIKNLGRLAAVAGAAIVLAGADARPRAAAALSIAFPTRLAAGPDFATDVLGDPWDMSNPEDISLYPGETVGWSDFAVSAGLAGGTTTTVNGGFDTSVSFLYRGFYGIINPGRNGRNFPIDTSKYQKLAFRISDLRGGEIPAVYWFHNPWTDPAATDPTGMGMGVKVVSRTALGYKIIVSDLATGHVTDTVAWTDGPVRGFRIDPNNNNAGQQVFFDWVRLTLADNAPGAAMQNISWDSGFGTATIDVIEPDGTVLNVASAVSGTSFNWNYGILAPGAYTLRVTTSDGSVGTQTFTINNPPIVHVTDPDETGGQDYATAVLGNAWDMDSSADIRLTGSDNITGLSFSGGRLNATNTNNDPNITLVNNDNNATPIDTSKYRFLTYSLEVEGAYDLGAGSVARVIWGSQQSLYGGTATTTKDIIVLRGMNTYTIDLASLSTAEDGGLELDDGAREAWASGSKRHFRFEPHEFTTPQLFHIDNVKLAAMDEADGAFIIRFTGSDADPGDSPTVTLYYDTDTNPANGKTQIVAGVALASAGQYTWSTSGVIPGVYYIYAEANDGIQTYGRYSTGQIQVNLPTITPDPLMSVDAPANNSTRVQPFTMAGWAIDRGGTSGTGVDTVHVWAFPSSGSPVFVGVASYFGPRDDVAAAFGSARFVNSGFNITVTGLSPGTYTIVAYAHSTVSGTFNQARSVTLTVTIPSSLPAMSLDGPADGATVEQTFNVGGWAIDRGAATGTGVSTVHVWAFPVGGGSPIFLGVPAYGEARGDVGAVFGSQFTNSGFFLRVNNLAPGTYRIIAYVHSTVAGAFNQERGATITVTGPQPNPAMSIDTPPSGSTRTQPFLLGGWAIDRGATSGTGVDTVHVWAFPVGGGSPAVFVGVASYGATRGDVGAVFGSQFTNSGYNISVAGLAAGTYDIAVYAHSTVTGTFNQSSAVRVTIP